MDRIINTKTDKQTIYEIYRACRLCGGGAGYKMPIVQTVIDLDNHGVELKQKILECLQIEVKAVPAVIAIRNGLIVDKFIGLVDADMITSLIDRMSGKTNEEQLGCRGKR